LFIALSGIYQKQRVRIIKQMKKPIVGWIFICCSAISYAQVDTPEECILNTLKSGAMQKELGTMVTYNCVLKYIKQMESKAKFVALNYIKSANLKYLPGFTALNNSSIMPSFELQLKNNSHLTIIYAFIKIKNEQTNEENIYRLNAERPIMSLSPGILRGYAIPISDPTTFWEKHSWGFTYVFGVE
jgi:hypothetical protein